jgi:MYXO-CTERM domain-containing protein
MGVHHRSTVASSSPPDLTRTVVQAGRSALLLAALFVASCSGGAPVSQTEQVSAALQSDSGAAADGGTACTLAGATTAGLQGDCAAGLWCNLATDVCQSAYLPAGAAIPLPNATHGCSDAAALSACSSGSCNSTHTRCGCQIDQDCPGGQTCSQQTFDCTPPAGSGVDAGADAVGPGAATDSGAPMGGDAAGGSGGSAGGGSAAPDGAAGASALDGSAAAVDGAAGASGSDAAAGAAGGTSGTQPECAVSNPNCNGHYPTASGGCSTGAGASGRPGAAWVLVGLLFATARSRRAKR